MKTILLLILIFITTGVMAMTKEEIKNKVLADAKRIDGDIDRADSEEILTKLLINKYGLTIDEIIQLAKDYVNANPDRAKVEALDPENIFGLDAELRQCARMGKTYFSATSVKELMKEVHKQSDEIEKSGVLDKLFGNTGLPNWAQWLIIAGFGFVTVPPLIKAFTKKKDK